ncbi:MAG TPA: hypothetical protein VEJ36_01595 [Nitrososphaerales archaeon]|nr:hypothetical protein [Nitrososphaerales archaeon]
MSSRPRKPWGLVDLGNGKFRVSITIDEGLMARIVKLHTTPSALVGRP